MDVVQREHIGAGRTNRERGEWLVTHHWQMERGEAAWLEALGDFDRHQGWAADGALSTVAWLMWRTDMARATAFEKVRIARELRRRPIVAEAFQHGRLSYSAVRTITRIEGPTDDVDAALFDLAEAGSIADVERATRVYQRYADQERPLPPPEQARGLRMVANGDGTTSVTIVLTDLEAAELAATVQAFLDLRAGPFVGEDQVEASPSVTSARSPVGDAVGPDAATSSASAAMLVPPVEGQSLQRETGGWRVAPSTGAPAEPMPWWSWPGLPSPTRGGATPWAPTATWSMSWCSAAEPSSPMERPSTPPSPAR